MSTLLQLDVSLRDSFAHLGQWFGTVIWFGGRGLKFHKLKLFPGCGCSNFLPRASSPPPPPGGEFTRAFAYIPAITDTPIKNLHYVLVRWSWYMISFAFALCFKLRNTFSFKLAVFSSPSLPRWMCGFTLSTGLANTPQERTTIFAGALRKNDNRSLCRRKGILATVR